MSDSQPVLTGDLTLSGDQGTLELVAFLGAEEVSRAYRYQVYFESDSANPDLLRGTNAAIRLSDAHGNERVVNGFIENVSCVGTDQDNVLYRITVRPEVYKLAYRSGFCIHQEKNVIDIAKQVLETAGLDVALIDDSNLDAADYLKRNMCVMYEESEWDFLCRLFEDEGIWFRFRQEDGRSVMELWDDSTAAPLAEPETVFFDPQGEDAFNGIFMSEWELRARATVAKVATNDYDYRNPQVSLLKEQSVEDPFAREHYEYPALYTAKADGNEVMEPAFSERRAKIRLEEHRSEWLTGWGRTNAIHFEAGQRCSLLNHPSADGSYFIRQLRYHVRFRRTDEAILDLEPAPQRYEVQIGAMPTAKPGAAEPPAEADKLFFRPARVTPKPCIVGLQTCRVTTSSEDEPIHCDEDGRVKVQFHWDRDGELDDKTSCYVRVGQMQTTGSVMVPRKGWECLVEFIDGNPDRPNLLGRVYNPLFPPEYALPDNKNMMGLRSQSLSGQGVNEITYDDSPANELLTINGCHDIDRTVANDRVANVTQQANQSVGRNRIAETKQNQTVTAEGNHTASVTGDHDNTVGGNLERNVSGGLVSTITGNHNINIGASSTVIIGNPAAAALEFLAREAIRKVGGRVAAAVGRGTAGLPAALQRLPGGNRVAGVLGTCASAGNSLVAAGQRALGPVAPFAGPATALLAGGDPTAAIMGNMAGQLLGSGNPAAGATSMGTGMAIDLGAEHAAHAISHSLWEHGDDHGGDAGGAGSHGGEGAAGGGAGGGDPAAAGTQDAAGGSTSGSGNWGTNAGGDVTESVGAAGIWATASMINIGIGGSSSETIIGARIEKIKHGKAENVGIGKVETVAGLYKITTKSGYSIDAKGAVALNAGGRIKLSSKEGHSMSGRSSKIGTTKIAMEAETLTLKCGQSEVAISKSGVEIKGLQVEFKASKIQVDPSAIKPG